MVLLKIKNFAVNSLDVVTRIIKRSSEIKKFKDPRRKAIFETVQLSDMQKKQIDELFINNYGRKIPYTWHRHFTAYTGRFDVNYIPELLYIPEFERYMNIKSAYTKTLGDKNVLPLVAQSVGVKMPKTIIARCEGLYRNESCNMLTEEEVSSLLCNIGEVFAKPTVDTCSGIGCRLLNFVNGVDVISEKINGLKKIDKDLKNDIFIIVYSIDLGLSNHEYSGVLGLLSGLKRCIIPLKKFKSEIEEINVVLNAINNL